MEDIFNKKMLEMFLTRATMFEWIVDFNLLVQIEIKYGNKNRFNEVQLFEQCFVYNNRIIKNVCYENKQDQREINT